MSSQETKEPEGEFSVEELLEQARLVEDSEPGRARSLVQRARVLARSLGDKRGEAEAVYHLAELAYAAGNVPEALLVAREARNLAHDAGAAMTEVSSLNLIAAVHYGAANLSDALQSIEQAIALYRTTGKTFSEGQLLNMRGLVEHALGELDKALGTYENALMANQGENRLDATAVTVANMAKVRADRGEHLLAVSLGEQALALAKEHDPEFVPEILARLAMSYVALQSLDRAALCLDDAEGVLLDRTGRRVGVSPASVVAVRTARGELYVAQGVREHALREWADALDLASKAEMSEEALKLHKKLADLNRELGRFEAALQHHETRYTLLEEWMTHGAKVRVENMLIEHESRVLRLESEITRLRTTELEQLVTLRSDEMQQYQVEAFTRIAVMAEHFNTDTDLHPGRVGVLAAELAIELGLDEAYAQQLSMAAQLHDIGKVGISDTILLKPGPLTAQEFEQMQLHTVFGHDILRDAQTPMLQLAAEVAHTHHERWDGSGYPRGISRATIPLSARIVTVADVYDALVSERVYKSSWPELDAVNYVLAGRNFQFDPQVVDAFVRVLLRRHPELAPQLDPSLLG
ncbi:MAG: HD domain-containing phosphohydrolase [Ilumatobacteraceae bacterium]